MSNLISKYDPSVYDSFRLESPDLYEDFIDRGEEIFNENLLEILNIVRKTMRPDSSMSVDQCADAYRFITSKSSATPGKYDVSQYEIARGPQAAITEPGVRTITALGPTQLFKSSLLENTALWYALINPGPVMLVQPSFRDAVDFMAQKLQPMFDNTPATKGLVYKMTKFDVLFIGGHITLAAATSENSLASRLAVAMLYDEVAKYGLIRGRNPVFFGDKRLETFGPFGRSVRASSPTTEENYMWEQYWKLSDRRQPFIVCPECGHDHVMRWEPTDDERERYFVKHGKKAPDYNVTWIVDPRTGNWDFESASYNCPECGHPFTYGERRKAISELKWRQTRPFSCCGEYQDPEALNYDRMGKSEWKPYLKDPHNPIWTPTIRENDGYEIVGRATCRHCGNLAVPNTHAGFNASRLYSPKHLSEMTQKWKSDLSIAGGKASFYNDELGLPAPEGNQVKLTADGLKAREEEYDFELPSRVVVITAGVDTQPDRFEVEIVGWGRGFESWSLDYIVIEGSPDDPVTRARLDEVLQRVYVGADGREQGIQAVAVDSGGENQDGMSETGRHRVQTTRIIYAYCHQRFDRNVWAIKGDAEKGDVIRDPWPKSPTPAGQYKTPLYIIGKTVLFNEVHGHLQITTPGPGYCHFPVGREMYWYNGLLAEKRIKVGNVMRWRKKDSTPNEPQDCRAYALAALEGLKAKYENPFLVEDIADDLGIGVDLTDYEKEQFTDDMLERIGEQTKRAIEQNRARPVAKIEKRPTMPKIKPADADSAPPPRPDPGPLAKVVPNALESRESDRSRWMSSDLGVTPERRKVPWSKKRD
jgi:phage terminase large subunit GpA-like protein